MGKAKTQRPGKYVDRQQLGTTVFQHWRYPQYRLLPEWK